MKLALARTVAGSAIALAARPWLIKAASEAADRGAAALAALIVMMASLAACLIPALRAARVDPAVALRQE
jgi:hypothetical protein